ncbi:hypothetical protein, partial [Pantoea sp.]|uniref:hypothetical protein n=1 Tax=Pantoea sp. TaxID=69393 RepID=UPI0031D56CBC
PPSQRHPCRFVLAVTLHSALRMALTNLACETHFILFWAVLSVGPKAGLKDSCWLKKTKDTKEGFCSKQHRLDVT